MSRNHKELLEMTDQEVTMRDTKATILAAYEDALERIEQLEAQQFDPDAIKAKEADQTALEVVENRDWQLGQVFVAVREKIDDNLRHMQSSLEKEREDLEHVRRAKAALQRELKDLYGISAQAQSFAALLKAQQERSDAFETKMREAQERLRQEAQEAKEAIAEAEQQAEIDRARKKTEWDYNFTRECQAKTDKVNDDLQAKIREHNTLIEAEYKALKERTEAIEKTEAEIQTLRDRVAGIPAEIEAMIADTKKGLATSHAIEVSALKRNHEADLKIVQHEAATLRDAFDTANAKIEVLEEKLESAYEKIQGVATAALDAQGNARTTAEVQRAVQSSAPSGKR